MTNVVCRSCSLLKRKSKNGFAPIIIVAAIAVVALIGFSAYLVLNNGNQEDATQTDQAQQDDQESTETQQSEATDQDSNSENTASNPSNQQEQQASNESQYLVIEEWGVKIPLTEEQSKASVRYEFKESEDEDIIYITEDDFICGSELAALNRLGSIDPRVQYPEEGHGYVFEVEGVFWSTGLSRHCGNEGVTQDEATAVEEIRSEKASAWLTSLNQFVGVVN